jgi:hypothetical protein
MAEAGDLALDLERETRRGGQAATLARGVVRALAAMGHAALVELPLGTGRRADVVGLDGRGRFVIVEIKSSLADFRTDGKWPDYLPHCDRFYFAVPSDFPRHVLPEAHGVMVADAYGAEIVRPSPVAPMAERLRRRQWLRFARHGAARLMRRDDPMA